ncbi:MAG TPA: DUF2061 domain-containing protein [Azospirillum sp.]|nr:DUF2061 domain-containing protein [Azospirillum sp.]
MTRWWTILCAFVVCLAAPATAQVDSTISGHFAVAGKQVPLPTGTWRLLGWESVPAAGKAARPLERAVLARVEGERMDAFVLVTANAAPADAGWGMTRDCTRDDIHFAAIHYVSAMDGSCTFVNHVVSAAAPESAPVWLNAERAARARGWSTPTTWLMAGFRFTDRRDVVDVRYHFNPEAFGFGPGQGRPWSESRWAPGAVSADPGRARMVAALVRWAAEAVPVVEGGFRNRLDGWPALANPDPAGTSPEPSAGGTASLGDGPSWGVGLMKTISWRVVGTVGDLGVAYLFTGDPVLSGGLAFTGAILNSILYFGHEMAWGSATSGQAEILEFATAGTGS